MEEIGAGEADRPFIGAACVSKGSFLLVLRRESRGAVCYSQVGARVTEGPTLVAGSLAGGGSGPIAAFRVITDSPEEVVVEADTAAGSGRTMAGVTA